MIKINKNLADIPTSLKPPTVDYFPPPDSPIRQSKTTHQRRQELIDTGAYTDATRYSSRYKCKDIKDALKNIYNKKCAFCEVSSDDLHVEHFHPKKSYYWLTYSWDNLLLACPSCNVNKGSRFDILGIKYNFVFDPVNTYRSIHASCQSLDRTEQPLLVNPEVEDLTSELIFDQNGGVTSCHPRVSHTINQCKLSSDDLKYRRKKLIDNFIIDVEAAFLENLNDPIQQKAKIEAFVEQFVRLMNSSGESFLAFRKFALANGWLQSIIKNLN